MQILVVDDSTTVRGLMKKALLLIKPDCVVREASDGKSAFHELGQGKVDLIITDLEMPGVDGHRFLQTLRQNPLLRRKKVLVFSSAISDEIRSSFSDNPNVAFLSKPANQNEISDAINGLLSACV